MKMQRRNYLHQKKTSIAVISVFVTSKQKYLQFMRAKRPKVNNPFLLDFITVITLPIQKCHGLSDVRGGKHAFCVVCHWANWSLGLMSHRSEHKHSNWEVNWVTGMSTQAKNIEQAPDENQERRSHFSGPGNKDHCMRKKGRQALYHTHTNTHTQRHYPWWYTRPMQWSQSNSAGHFKEMDWKLFVRFQSCST